VFARVVLLISAGIFGYFGALTLWSPSRMAAMVDFALTTPTASVELRAMYGGLGIGIALFLLLAAFRSELAPAGLWATALMLGGLGAGRLAGLLLTPGARPVMWIALAVEVVGGVMALLALRSLPPR
jgi:hypothetical protein